MDCPICLEHSGMLKALDNLCLKIKEKEKKTELLYANLHEAISLAKTELDRRLEAMNEFREQLSVQATTFISRKEVELLLEKMEIHFRALAEANREKIESLKGMEAQQKGSKQWSDHILTALIAIATFLIFHYVWKF